MEEVLNYCYENRLDEAFLTISHGLEDFSFMRSQYDKLMRSLHDMGVTVARRSGQYKELLNIYGYKMKHAVQKNQKERAKGIFKEAEELIRKDKRFTEISFAQCPEYAHGKALVLFLVEKKFSDAAVIWEEIAEQNEVDERSKLLYRFWKSKCIFNEQNAALGELEEVFQQMLRECEEFRYYILTTECNLYLATIYMLMALKEKDAFYLESVQKHLNDTVHAMKHCCFMENRYKMHFRILSYYLSAINHNEEYQTLFTDSSIQWRNWTKQVAEKLYKNGLDNINYGEIAGEIVRFLPQQ